MQNPINKERYNFERKHRWGMANQSEELAIIQIVNLIKVKLSNCLQDISYVRYDEIVHKEYPPEQHEWAKGCPDYFIKILIKDSKNRSHYIFFEIKLKAEEFRKTINGGLTTQGSVITRYNCPSYYLDIVPVLKNMNDFCRHTDIDKLSFIVAFVPMSKKNTIDVDGIMVISLSRINDILENGWFYYDENKNNEKVEYQICKYGEGYGQVTYLIPKSATINLKNMSENKLLLNLKVTNCLPIL